MRKNNIYQYIFFVFVIIMMTSCLPPSMNTHVNCPAAPPDNNTYWFESGEGHNVEEACNVALNQIAKTISAHIQSTFKSVQHENNSGGHSRVDSTIEVNVKDIHFPGYDIVQKKNFGSTSCAVIKVNKQKFLTYHQDEFNQLSKSIENLYHQINSKHVFEILKRKENWTSQLEKAKSIASMLSTFGYKKPQKIINTTHMQYNNSVTTKLDSAKVYIQHSPPAKYIAEHMKALLTENNVQIASSKSYSNSLAVLDIDGHVKKLRMGDEYLVKLSINIRLKTVSNQSIAQKNYNYSGISLIGFESALQNASQQFKTNAQSTGIYDTLGL